MSEHLHLDLHHLRTAELARDAERRRLVAERRASAPDAGGPSARRRPRHAGRRAGSRTWGLPAGASPARNA